MKLPLQIVQGSNRQWGVSRIYPQVCGFPIIGARPCILCGFMCKGADIVLGVQWLAEFEDITTNHKALTISFKMGDEEVQGESLLCQDPITVRGVNKLASENSLACLYSMRPILELDTHARDTVPAKIQEVITRFADIFGAPSQLPLEREVDHKIDLLPGSKLVAVRPYHYPYFQRTEIERLFHPYKQATSANRLSFKLAKRYYSPFQVQSRVGAVAYCLQFPLDNKVHPVFHVSRLKEFKGPLPTAIAHLPEQPLAFVQQPMTIIDIRNVKKGESVRKEALVEWEGGDRNDATWEDLITLTKVFPEDKLVFNGKGTDTIMGEAIGPSAVNEVPNKPNPVVKL
ncbi:Retrotransposable element Tf2 [Senna tora]|uniref:Retrotransposable element Tf2 n=1 Tax=Senna tora TaxID=362788 RepID=A0A834WGE2_9FABA|nr:Retrotransposable element Tf2 [Senna tora]